MSKDNKKETGRDDMNAMPKVVDERYCTVLESLEESLKEVKRIRENKITKKTWDQYLKEQDKTKGK